jgi:hypothetical protein
MLSSEFWPDFLPAGKDFTIPAPNFLPAGIPFLELPKGGHSQTNLHHGGTKAQRKTGGLFAPQAARAGGLPS